MNLKTLSLWMIPVSLLTLLSAEALAQAVISANSGLVYFSEGTVLMDGQAISHISGRFPELHDNCLLSTKEGRAELLLAPGVLLWLGRNSALVMHDSSLADARVELIEGSAIVQSTEIGPDDAVTMIHGLSQVRLSSHGLYRIDAVPPQIIILEGQASVISDQGSMAVTEGQCLAFPSGLISPAAESKPDNLDLWALARRQAILAENLNREKAESRANRNKNPHRKHQPYPVVVIPLPGRVR